MVLFPDIYTTIQAGGLIGIFLIVFAESGLLIGFFLPGDSLLFTAGFLASQGYFNIILVMLVSFLGAVLGDSVGYAIGIRTGPKIFTRDDSLVFNKKNLEYARYFYERHGGITITLARFMPVARTLIPVLAGVGRMHYPTFLFYNILGGIFWGIGLTTFGYVLGSTIPDIDRYLLPVVLAVIVVSILPGILRLLWSKDTRIQMWRWIRHKFKW